jgi:uncharacterized protein (TIGR02266 family)
MRRCPACRQQIPGDSKFCGLCGFRLQPISRRGSRVVSRHSAQERLREGRPGGFGRSHGNRLANENSTACDPQEPGRKRRRYPRFPLRVEVTYQSAHNFFTGFSENISEGGLFVATYTPATLGSEVEVTFTVPGLGDPCVAQCEVVWVREHDAMNSDMEPGMGLRFAELSGRALEAVELFIEHREPIFFDD